MTSSTGIVGTVTVNLQFSGALTPSTAICDNDAAPSQYQRRRAFFSCALFPSRLSTSAKKTPALAQRIIHF